MLVGVALIYDAISASDPSASFCDHSLEPQRSFRRTTQTVRVRELNSGTWDLQVLELSLASSDSGSHPTAAGRPASSRLQVLDR